MATMMSLAVPPLFLDDDNHGQDGDQDMMMQKLLMEHVLPFAQRRVAVDV